jgi:hypothetical protein
MKPQAGTRPDFILLEVEGRKKNEE